MVDLVMRLRAFWWYLGRRYYDKRFGIRHAWEMACLEVPTQSVRAAMERRARAARYAGYRR